MPSQISDRPQWRASGVRCLPLTVLSPGTPSLPLCRSAMPLARVSLLRLEDWAPVPRVEPIRQRGPRVVLPYGLAPETHPLFFRRLPALDLEYRRKKRG